MIQGVFTSFLIETKSLERFAKLWSFGRKDHDDYTFYLNFRFQTYGHSAYELLNTGSSGWKKHIPYMVYRIRLKINTSNAIYKSTYVQSDHIWLRTSQLQYITVNVIDNHHLIKMIYKSLNDLREKIWFHFKSFLIHFNRLDHFWFI